METLRFDRPEQTARLEDGGGQPDMIGNSAPMLELARAIAMFAPLPSNVLIEGESGTGKELVAEALHRNSARSRRSFTAVNCAALPEGLIESELFGHERGSFTGAVAQEKGRFELADGGTLFLDEVAELSLSVQPKLLRVLEKRTIDRIGGKRPIPVDIRIVAATNRNLQREVAAGRFRADLYYRLRVLYLKTAPLRERRQDIALLAQFFLLKSAERAGRIVRSLSNEAETILSNYDWPGNVRELQNVIEQAVVMSSAEILLPKDLPASLLKPPQACPSNFDDAVEEFKRQLLSRAVDLAQGNCTRAAWFLGLHPKTVQRYVRPPD